MVVFATKTLAAWIIQKHPNIQKEVKIGWIQLSFLILKKFSQKKGFAIKPKSHC